MQGTLSMGAHGRYRVCGYGMQRKKLYRDRVPATLGACSLCMFARRYDAMRGEAALP